MLHIHIKEAYRYFANAKETLSKSSIQYNRFTDAKFVSEAAGIGYLAALKAINAYLISIGVSESKLPESVEQYRDYILKKVPHNGKLMSAFNTVYENLHLFAYYKGGTGVKMVKEGFENCKKIIDMMAGSVKKSTGYFDLSDDTGKNLINEPSVRYKTKRSKRNPVLRYRKNA
ncbi:MAG: DUF5618 family protein [Bacteroidetes bacterium]|nr:DUF5618 family protein [Bacteroidota bacterium]